MSFSILPETFCVCPFFFAGFTGSRNSKNPGGTDDVVCNQMEILNLDFVPDKYGEDGCRILGIQHITKSSCQGHHITELLLIIQAVFGST